MRFLTVLFSVLSVVAVMLAVLVGISHGLGRYLYSRRIVTALAGGADESARFNADREWYDALPPWEKIAIVAWWLVNRYLWATQGYK